ncbi:MAG: efflux RND transporter periplasmic adaptor subunit [Patescibacteria group bacterium]
MLNKIGLGSVQNRIMRIKELRRNQRILILLVILILAVVLYQQVVIKDILEETVMTSEARLVEVSSVKDLTLDNTPLPLLGKVQSQSSAIIYSQSAGEVIGLYKKEGDFVWADQIIGEIDNWAQRSTVIQAEANVEMATAQLEKIKKGAREEQISILKATLNNSQNSLNETKASVINTLNDAYGKSDDAIRNKIDPMFRDPRNEAPQLLFSVNDSQLEIDLEWGRRIIEEMLKVWEKELSVLNTEADLIKALNTAKDNVDSVRTFLDKMATAVNVLTPNSNLSETTIATWKANVSASRSVINLVVASIPASINSLNGANSSLSIAQLNYEQALSGERTEDIISAEAQLKQAQAGLQVAYSSLEKTILRAPISGTINDLGFEKGDFVSTYAPLVTIANNAKLEIVSYITEVDRSDIQVGANVLVGKKWKGTVKTIAPALDSQTKKIKVEISLIDSDVPLTNGQSIALLVERFVKKEGSLSEFSVPISAIKIGADNTVVFTINNENRLVAHPVLTGPILGEKITILDGVTEDMVIVTDARGLREGQEVVLAPSLGTSNPEKKETDSTLNNLNQN